MSKLIKKLLTAINLYNYTLNPTSIILNYSLKKSAYAKLKNGVTIVLKKRYVLSYRIS